MNREIKFRVWNGSEMTSDIVVGRFGIFYVNPSNNGIDEKDSASLSPFNTKYRDDIPLMQYTGLKDKNGKEVYEGDLISNRLIIFQIVFEKYMWLLKPIRGGKQYSLIGLAKAIEKNYWIIGNIYENPELLK